MPSHECIYGRVDYETMASTTSPNLLQAEEHLLTKDGKHRLMSWRFVRTRVDEDINDGRVR